MIFNVVKGIILVRVVFMSEVIGVLKNSIGGGLCRFHTWENHYFHLGRYGRCRYCELGSKPVCKSTIVNELRSLNKI